jgi:hypothetical protein
LKQSDAGFSRQDVFRWLVMAFLAVGSFFLLYGFRAAAQTGDSLNYAQSIKTGSDLFHPHHLLFNPIIRFLFVLVSRWAGTVDVIAVAQIHNILWAIAAILAVFLVVRYLLRSVFWGAVAALFFLLTKGFWAYSTQVQVYVPAIGCLAIVSALLILRDKFVRTFPGLLIVAGVFSLSIFYHQSSLFYAIPMGYFLMAGKDRTGKKIFSIVLSLSGSIVVLAYVLAFWSIAGRKTLTAFVRYCLSYVYYPNPDWGTIKNVSFRGVGHVVLSQAKNFIFLSRAWYVPAAVVLAASLIALGIWHGSQILRKRNDTKIRIFSALWILPIYLFLLWYSPGTFELMIVTVLPILLLVFIALNDVLPSIKFSTRRFLAAVGLVFVLCLGFVNFRQAVWPAHRSRGPDYDEAKLLNMGTPQDSIIFSSWYVQQNLRYYFQREKALETDIALFCFYRSLALPGGYSVDPTRAVVISAAYLYPEAEISRVVIFNGYRSPREWLRFMEWLFQFEYDAERRVVSCRSSEVINLGSGYLVLSPDRMKVDGLADLMEKLDTQIRSRLSDPTPHFLNWIKKNPAFDEKSRARAFLSFQVQS